MARNLAISGEDGVNLRLWILRENLKLSVDEFALRAGVDSRVYAGYEFRGTPVSADFIARVAEYL